MDGIYFYWFLWLGWVVTTFLMKKNKIRSLLSIGILVLVIGSGHTIYAYENGINISFLLLVTFSLVLLSRKKQSMILYYALCSLILGLAFASFHLFEIFDPVWLFVSRKWLLAILIVYLSCLLVRNRWERLMIISLGIAQGEFLTFFVLKRFSMIFEVGSFSFLDVWAISMAVISTWNGFVLFTKYLEITVQKNITKHVQKGRAH